MIATVVELVMEQGQAVLAEGEDSECFEEMSTGFSKFNKLCKEDTYIMG